MHQGETVMTSNTVASLSGKRWPIVLLCVLLVACLIVGTVSVTIGVMNGIEQAKVIKSAPILTQVQAQSVEQKVDGIIKDIPLNTTSLKLPAQGVVTRDGALHGIELRNAQLITVVDEMPLMVCKGNIPMYRALGEGDTGVDVMQIQQCLASAGYSTYDKAGIFGASTIRALRDWYTAQKLGYFSKEGMRLSVDQIDDVGLAQHAVTFVPDVPVRVQGDCGKAGQSVQSVQCDLVSTKHDYMLEAKLSAIQQFANPESLVGKTLQGIPVEQATFTIHSIEHKANASIQTDAMNSIQKPDDAVESSTMNNDSEKAEKTPNLTPSNSEQVGSTDYVYYHVKSSKQVTDSLDGIPVTVVVAQSDKDSLSVASSAIRSKNNRSYLETAAGKKIEVTVGICFQGRCAITGREINPGMDVVIAKGDES